MKKHSYRKTYFSHWKIGDYFRQLSIVVAGIVITFIGSDIVNNSMKQRELHKSLENVRLELDNNLASVQALKEMLDKEYRFYCLISEHRKNYREIPADSLTQYKYICFQSALPFFINTAMETLKISGLLQQIGNQKLLLKLMNIYHYIDLLDKGTNDFYAEKYRCTENIRLKSDAEKFEQIFYSSSIYESWDLILQDIQIRNFMLHSTGSLESLLARYERAETEISDLLKELGKQ